jgi:hypothetical protein
MMNNQNGRRPAPMPPMPPRCNSCGCTDTSDIQKDPLYGLAVGIGYVPWQQWECVYTFDEGLSRGTIFPSLDLPFYGCIPRGYRCNKGGRA